MITAPVMKELKTIKKYKSVADHFRDMLINFDYVEIVDYDYAEACNFIKK